MARIISDLLPGTQVYVNETVSGTTTPVSYIYLGLDESNKARLLREYPVERKRMNSSNVAYYSGCEIDLWLENDFLSRFDEITQTVLENTSISFVDYSQSTYNVGQIVTINRKCFLMSSTELGFVATTYGSEGRSYIEALRAFYNVNTDNDARICYLESSSIWLRPTCTTWTRSASSTSSFYYITTSGTRSNTTAKTSSGPYPRPVIAVAAVTPVSDAGLTPIFLLPDGRDTYWTIRASVSLGQTLYRPKQVKLYLDTDNFYDEHYWVCNNYGDAAPMWMPCIKGGSCVLGQEKSSEHWELGVKMDVKSHDPSYSLGEPTLIVEFEEA